MRIYLNDNPHEVPEGISVDVLLHMFAIHTSNIAVEVNSQIVTKASYAETVLKDSDRIEIVTFVGGG